MSEQLNNHERRLSTLEGEMKSVATKADLAELKHELARDLTSDLTHYFQTALQTTIDKQNEFIEMRLGEQRAILEQQRETLEKQSDDIRKLRDKDSRLKGATDTIKIALPFLISVIAVVVAVLK